MFVFQGKPQASRYRSVQSTIPRNSTVFGHGFKIKLHKQYATKNRFCMFLPSSPIKFNLSDIRKNTQKETLNTCLQKKKIRSPTAAPSRRTHGSCCFVVGPSFCLAVSDWPTMGPMGSAGRCGSNCSTSFLPSMAMPEGNAIGWPMT